MCNILIFFVVLVYFLCVPKYLSIIIIIWLPLFCFLLANSNASGNAVQYEDILKSDHAGFLLNSQFFKDFFLV